MQLVCPSCASAYTIKPDALGTTGRTVRCPACATTWFAFPEVEEVAAPIVAAVAPPVAVPVPPSPPPAALVEIPAEVTRTLETASEPAAPRDAEALALVPSASARDPADAATDAPPAGEAASAEPRNGIEAAAARRRRPAPRAKPPRRSISFGNLNGAYVLAGFVFVLAVAMLWRQDVVRAVPDLAGLYARLGMAVNIRGLELRDVSARVDFEAGQPVTVIEGSIVNPTRDQLAVPRLRYSVRASDGHELISWAGPAPRPTIAPRESIPFRGRLTSPVQGGNDIEVRFLGRGEGGRGAP
jgi:predicted Zn finger-like uncharacterized protein